MKTSPLARLIDAGFASPQPLALPPPTPATRRRRKLWELPTRWHCPLIGTCLPVAEMRRLAVRAGLDERNMSDYALHAHVVGSCDSRGEIAELAQRFFEKRHAATVTRFARLRGEPEVLAAWRDALAAGNDVAGTLWAAWSHPDLSEDGGREFYGDIHMLSHQVGASARADLGQLERLRRDNAELRQQLAALQRGLGEAHRRKDKALAELERRLADAEQHAGLLERRELELADARRRARDYETLLARAEAMSRRIETL